MSISQQMDVVHPCSAILLSNRKETTTDTCNNIDESKNYCPEGKSKIQKTIYRRVHLYETIKKNRIAKAILRKKNKAGGITLSDLRQSYKTTIIQGRWGLPWWSGF